MDEKQKWDFEFTRVEIGLFKHLASLSAGAIALVAAFLRSLIEFDGQTITIAVVVVSFFCCIVGSVFISILLLTRPGYRLVEVSRFYKIAGYISGGASIFGFMIGIIGLLYFILSNI